ncbi:MAG: RagB/SusD family nutrient uptake outer membrane protein, partial [Tannerella sp.]|nr:RagB/SusD family nutrient uptake outer membrane protein [Tannerella sp.]
MGGWSYGGIRNINKFLENVDRCPSDKLSDELKAQYKAQLLVLRGWIYFNMVRMYGGVPLILHEQSLDEDLYVKREKTSVCIAQII